MRRCEHARDVVAAGPYSSPNSNSYLMVDPGTNILASLHHVLYFATGSARARSDSAQVHLTEFHSRITWKRL